MKLFMKCLKWVGIAIGLLLLMAISATANGYALSVLWGWFVVPLFDAPILSIPQAIGVVIVAHYLTHQVEMEDIDPKKTFASRVWDAVVLSTVKPTFMLAFGWVVHRFL